MLLGRAFASGGGPTRVLSIIARYPRARARQQLGPTKRSAHTLVVSSRGYAVAAALEKELDQPHQEEPSTGKEDLGWAPAGEGEAASHSSGSTLMDGAVMNSSRTPRIRRRAAQATSKLAATLAQKPSPATPQADALFLNLTNKGKGKERSHKSLPEVQRKNEQRRLRQAQRGLPPARRSLRYRTVLLSDIEDAERRFSQFTHGLDGEIAAWREKEKALQEVKNGQAVLDKWLRQNPHPRTIYADTLRAHLNHLLYLSARAGSSSNYNKFSSLFGGYALELDSRTHLTRLLMLDRRPYVSLSRITDIWKDWKQSLHVSGESTEGTTPELVWPADETVLANQTIWMLAKRGQWRKVGPAYREMLRNTSFASSTSSNAFPAEYFTPSNLLSGMYPAFHQCRADKVTYQSLIRALGFHGNVVAALNVMGDMLRDERGYTADISDYVAVMQGFARFGNSLEPEEAHRRQARRLSFQTESDLTDDLLEFFPPLIFPGLLPLVQVPERGTTASDTTTPLGNRQVHRSGGLKKLTEIWGSKIDGWIETPNGAQPRRERVPGMDLSILTKVFRAMLGTSPVTGRASTSSSSRYYARSRRIPLAPTPRATFIILMAFARCSDGDPEVLRSVWADLEDKFGPTSEEGWVGWHVDKRLKRIVGEIVKVGT